LKKAGKSARKKAGIFSERHVKQCLFTQKVKEKPRFICTQDMTEFPNKLEFFLQIYRNAKKRQNAKSTLSVIYLLFISFLIAEKIIPSFRKSSFNKQLAKCAAIDNSS